MSAFTRGGLFFLAVVLFVGCGTRLTGSGGPKINQVVPEVQGVDGDGALVKLSDYRGKVVVLDFWFADCPYCSLEHKDEITIVAKYKDRPFVLLGVNTDSDRETLKAAQTDQNMTWRSLWDQTRSITKTWGVDGFPTLFLIDAEGKLRHKFRGKTPIDELEKAIEKCLKEVTPVS
jgi:peroxiredoxin